MTITFKTFLLSLLAFGQYQFGHAAIVLTTFPVGSSADFPSNAFKTGSGSLGADSCNSSGAPALGIQGGTSQGIPAGTAIGEIFKWSGDKSTLNSIIFIATGSDGTSSYRFFLFDLGLGNFSLPSQPFAPRNHKNLFQPAENITVTNISSKSFVEVDVSGTNTIVLKAGHSYAFGLLSCSPGSSLCVERSGGAQSDPYGDGFTADSLKDTTDNASPFANSVRNVFIGVYAAPIIDSSIR